MSENGSENDTTKPKIEEELVEWADLDKGKDGGKNRSFVQKIFYILMILTLAVVGLAVAGFLLLFIVCLSA